MVVVVVMVVGLGTYLDALVAMRVVVVVVVVVVDGGEGGLRVVSWGCVGLFHTRHGDTCRRHNIFPKIYLLFMPS